MEMFFKIALRVLNWKVRHFATILPATLFQGLEVVYSVKKFKNLPCTRPL